jgi:hypothetical protein
MSPVYFVTQVLSTLKWALPPARVKGFPHNFWLRKKSRDEAAPSALLRVGDTAPLDTCYPRLRQVAFGMYMPRFNADVQKPNPKEEAPMASLLDENRLAVVARQHGIKKSKDSDSIRKLFAAYLRRAEESALGGLLVEVTILHTAMRQNATQVLRDAATAYKVDVDAIGLKVKQEFTAKEKARLAAKPPMKTVAKAQAKPAKKAKAA